MRKSVLGKRRLQQIAKKSGGNDFLAHIISENLIPAVSSTTSVTFEDARENLIRAKGTLDLGSDVEGVIHKRVSKQPEKFDENQEALDESKHLKLHSAGRTKTTRRKTFPEIEVAVADDTSSQLPKYPILTLVNEFELLKGEPKTSRKLLPSAVGTIIS